MKTDTAKVVSILRKQKITRAEDLLPYVATRTQLKRMAEDGLVVALGAGFYAAPSLDPFVATLAVTARYYPKAVISGVTALVVHGLSDERIDRVDIDIPRETTIRNILLRAHRVPGRLIVGVVMMNYHGFRLRIYSAERALCDAYRLDPEGELFFKALKRYVKRGDVDPEAIALLDKSLRTQVLRALTQELSDG